MLIKQPFSIIHVLAISFAIGLPFEWAALHAQETATVETEQNTDMAEVETAITKGDFVKARELLNAMSEIKDADIIGKIQFRLGHMLLEGRGGPIDTENGIRRLQESVRADYAPALLLLAKLHLKGSLVEKSPEKAAQLLDRASHLGSVASQLTLARLYQRGYGVTENPATAIKLFEKARQNGSHEAEFELSKHYARGWGVNKDATKALQLLTTSAEAGLPDAQLFLAFNYMQGNGVGKDTVRGLNWMTRAAEGGQPMAQRVLGTAYLQGNDIEQNNEEALRWLTLAAKAGEAGAQSNLGYIYATGKGAEQDYTKAFEWYEKASDQGLLRATTALANLYEIGNGVAQNLPQAISLYNEAASQGEPRAQNQLAKLITTGQAELPLKASEGIIWVADLALTGDGKALEWLEQKAQSGNVSAEARLGHFYTQNNTDQDVDDHQTKAFELLTNAASRGNAFGQYHLAQLYGTGSGVEQDYVQAHKWANLAAARGNPDAAKSRDLFSKLMTAEQIAEAQKLARTYVAKN
jgi:TPR repeat protein